MNDPTDWYEYDRQRFCVAGSLVHGQSNLFFLYLRALGVQISGNQGVRRHAAVASNHGGSGATAPCQNQIRKWIGELKKWMGDTCTRAIIYRTVGLGSNRAPTQSAVSTRDQGT